jgi:hypothetical protein
MTLKKETDKKNSEQWESYFATHDVSNVHVWLSVKNICYYDLIFCWERDESLWHTYVYVFFQHGHLLWCPIHTIFVTEYKPLHVNNDVNIPSTYATDLYHYVSLFIECLECHS